MTQQRLKISRCILPTSWTLKSVSGLQGWWKADAESYSDGGLVATITDQSANGRNLTASGAGRPTYKTNIVNTKPVYRFDGVATFASGANISNFISASAATTYVVAAVTLVVANGGYSSDEALIGDGAAGGYYGLSAKLGATVGYYNWDGTLDSAAQSVTLTAWQIFEARHESGTLYLNKNGGGETSTASGDTLSLGSPLVMGKTSTFFNGDIAEAAIYNVAVSSANRTLIRANLGAKYGITVS